MVLAELGVIAALDGDGVREPPPQGAVGPRLLAGGGGLEVLGGDDDRLPGAVEESLPMGAVKEQKGFPCQTVAEVDLQDRQHPVFGGDLPHQQAAVIGEADKACEQLALALKVADGLAQLQHGVVVQPLFRPLAHPEAEVDELAQQDFPLGNAGQEPLLHHEQTLAAQADEQAVVDPGGQARLGGDPPFRTKGWGQVVV